MISEKGGVAVQSTGTRWPLKGQNANDHHRKLSLAPTNFGQAASQIGAQTPMNDDVLNAHSGLLDKSLLLTEFSAERDEILRHKWLESEKANCDIGFEKALIGWVLRHRSAWLEQRRKRAAGASSIAEEL